MNFKLTWKIWLLIIILILSLISIFGFPPKIFQSGVLITSVQANSTAFNEGLRQGQKITAVDGIKVASAADLTEILSNKFQSGEKEKTVFKTDQGEFITFTESFPKITFSDISKTNLKTGLDLSGGSRALVRAQDADLSNDEVNELVDVIQNRLNVYGIADVKVSPVSDLSGNKFVLIEIAGATPEDLKSLISQQGKFEAKIGNQTTFTGGNDITSVCRGDPTCSGIRGCSPSAEGYSCSFQFTIYLSQEAAQKQADLTRNLKVNTTNVQGRYLEKNLDLYLDDNLVDSLLIGESLKGVVTTQVSISGSGSGANQEEALKAAQADMQNLQTILVTGSLPYKLEIVKLDTISPNLGNEFLNSIFIAGIAALLAISIIIFIRYRKFKISIAMIFTSVSEIIILLGVASLIKWNLDLPSIAGILAAIGTGVDDQIVIVDESKGDKEISLKARLKRAFSIILGAYFTALVSLLPLFWAGAGLLKGFALTTIIGISTGVLIARPAFSDIVRLIGE